jgi:hypothetical protein
VRHGCIEYVVWERGIVGSNKLAMDAALTAVPVKAWAPVFATTEERKGVALPLRHGLASGGCGNKSCSVWRRRGGNEAAEAMRECSKAVELLRKKKEGECWMTDAGLEELWRTAVGLAGNVLLPHIYMEWTDVSIDIGIMMLEAMRAAMEQMLLRDVEPRDQVLW